MADNRQVYKWCKVQKKVLPIEQCLDHVYYDKSDIQLMSDEMPLTRHPANGGYYSSKARFREETKRAGLVEIGNEYKNGYNPEAAHQKRLEKLVLNNTKQQVLRIIEGNNE